MALPENSKRITKPQYEEIGFPAPKPIKLPVEPTLVPIDSLDEVRYLLFYFLTLYYCFGEFIQKHFIFIN